MRKIFLCCVALILGSPALAQNYQATQGSGTTFGTKLVSAVNYPQFVLCDPTTPSQCVAVDSSGRFTLVPNQSVNVAQINGVTPLMGNGVTGTGSPRVTIASDNTAFSVNATLAAETTKVIGTVRVASGGVASGSYASGAIASGAMVDLGAQADSVCGSATGACSLIALQKYLNSQAILSIPAQTGIGNVNIGAVQSAGSAYKTVAASATATVLGATGATGDYLSHCVIYPATTSPGVVTVFDNANAAATNVIAFAGGASSTSNLTPISVPVGALSTAGAWKVTTGTNVSVSCYGKFT